MSKPTKPPVNHQEEVQHQLEALVETLESKENNPHQPIPQGHLLVSPTNTSPEALSARKIDHLSWLNHAYTKHFLSSLIGWRDLTTAETLEKCYSEDVVSLRASGVRAKTLAHVIDYARTGRSDYIE
jgi:hypothetical protein